ncbi:25683_t:CDS:2 [Dentiscutata erythropus]|uniref:25683_t:CDS:1 n=1 Tax=Dentiscutata erythropus TaxID=1348616 RepID=A0A9N8VA94_9GLOM|nr:25683_t:CDS:2 [Dentiscutata erythropus]
MLRPSTSTNQITQPILTTPNPKYISVATTANPNTNRKRSRNLSNISSLATTSNKATKAVLDNTSTSFRIQAN